MSFFQKKILSIKVGGKRLKFEALSQKELIEFQKLQKKAQETDTDEAKETDAMLDVIVDHLVTDEGEEAPTKEDFLELSPGELIHLVREIGSVNEAEKLSK